MTVVINFLGSPGSGKSTAATYCFSMSKDAGFNSEYVAEKAKEWAWEKRKISLLDQFTLFQNQTQREKRLFLETDLVFTDSPIWLSYYYASLMNNSNAASVIHELCKEFYAEAAAMGVTHYFVWINRVKPYNPKGRFQTEQETNDIANDMKGFFSRLGVDFVHCDGRKELVWERIQSLLPEINK